MNLVWNIAVSLTLGLAGFVLFFGGVTALYFNNKLGVMYCMIPSAGMAAYVLWQHSWRMIYFYRHNIELDESSDISHAENAYFWIFTNLQYLTSVPMLLDSVVKDKLKVVWDFPGSTNDQKLIFLIGISSFFYFRHMSRKYRGKLDLLTGRIPQPTLLLTWPEDGGHPVPLPNMPTKEPQPKIL